MRAFSVRSRWLAAAVVMFLPSLAAQTPIELKVGDVAPDFTLPAATREGVRSTPVTLASLRGQTVVLAFFYKARTKG